MHQSEYPVVKIIRQLEDDQLCPAILFRTSRKNCDNDIERLAKARDLQLNLEHQNKIADALKALVKKYDADYELVFTHPQVNVLITYGVGAHHAGQLLLWRLLLEELMTLGILRLLIATGTVAAGVDFPARSVVITAHSKRGNEGFNTLQASELQQMSGRAGRRGKDTVGFCIVAPGPFCDARVISEVAKRPPEPLKSAYFASPSSVLNLLKFRTVDDLRYMVERSLAAFLDRKQATKLRESALEAQQSHQQLNHTQEKKLRKQLREADELEAQQSRALDQTLEGLTKLGYIEGSMLSEKGLWAANLCTNLVLELAEATAAHIFTDLTAMQLIGAVSSIAGDSHRTYLTISRNSVPKEIYSKLSFCLSEVQKAFREPFNSGLTVVPDASVTVMTWAESRDWIEYSGLLRLGSVTDGDAARLINQTAEHLNQLAKLHKTHTELARTASEARRMILRPPLTDVID